MYPDATQRSQVMKWAEMQGNPKAQARGKGGADVSSIRFEDEEEIDDDAPFVVDDRGGIRGHRPHWG